MIRKYTNHIYIPTTLALAHFNLLPSTVATLLGRRLKPGRARVVGMYI